MAQGAVTEQSEKFWAAAKERNAEALIAHYAMEAQLLPPNARIARGRDDVRSALLTILATPDFQIEGRATRIEAAMAGDIAWETGMFTIHMRNDQGEIVTWPGKYVTIWKKRAGGEWRIISNIFNSDLRGAELTSTLK
jgi:ketosteroid isomerase-like protein